MTGRPSVLGSGLAAGLAAVCVATGAQAGSGAVFGEASRTAALADAVTARPGELSAIFYNPGAFADLEQSQAAFGAHVGRLQLTYGRDGEPEHTDERTIAGFSLAVGARLPGPDWLRAFRVGIAAHVPAGHAVKLLAPSRPDEPYFPLYRGRVERTSITATLAAKLFSRIGVGVGVMLNPTLYSPTVARYEAWRSPDPDDNVMLSMDRELRLGAAAVAGLRAQVVDQLALGLAYRQEIGRASCRERV